MKAKVAKFQEISNLWHTSKNGSLKPDNFTIGSAKKVWWKCEKGHEWKAIINTRTIRGYGCPHCRKKKVT
tara:strand:+ start:422 stop:631 length:210 start_codon:yes stop_codon:yes gene_type:complete